jgi:hypothetical protein
MTTKHTPAQWTTDNCVDYIDIIDANKNTIVVVENDNQHNAKLIAAAPELLDCLLWYVENDDTNDTEHNEFYIAGMNRAKDVIAKVTGE